MADQNITELPIKTSEQITSSDKLLGIDLLEGYQVSMQDFGNYTIQNATSTLAGSTQTVASAINTINSNMDALSARVSTLEESVDWLQIVNDARVGNVAKYPIGTEISDPWIDVASSNTSYDNPWRVNHYETVETEGGVQIPGMWLQNKYAHPFGVQFSHQRAFLRCPNGLEAGSYYFTIESKWGNNVNAGDVVSFTLTQDVPEGGKLAGCYGAPDQEKSKWRIYAYSADGTTILETVTPTFEATGTDLGTQKLSQRSGDLNSTQEMAYGWNRWKTSAIRQWLNSSMPKGQWWTAQDDWDIAPDQLNQKAGFLTGLSESLLASIRPVKYTTFTNTVNDGGEADITYDKVGLISLEQMYINPQVSGEGAAHEYWKQLNGTETKWAQSTTYEILKQYAVENHSSAQYVRLRSASRGYAHITWYVNSSGNVNINGASHAYRVEPLVFIG